MDVRVHVLDKDWNIKREELLDYLPYVFRFTFYPDNAPVMYNGAVTMSDVYDDDKYEKVRALIEEWMTIVPVSSVKAYMKANPEEIGSAEIIQTLDDNDLLCVTGDQLYSDIAPCTAPAVPFGQETPYTWFDNLSTEDREKLNAYSAVLFDALASHRLQVICRFCS